MLRFTALALLVLPVVLLLAGCATPSNVTERLDAIDKKLEKETDAVGAFALERGCSAPVDFLERNLSTDEMLEGAYLLCQGKPLGDFSDRMTSVVNRRNEMLEMLNAPKPGTASMTGS